MNSLFKKANPIFFAPYRKKAFTVFYSVIFFACSKDTSLPNDPIIISHSAVLLPQLQVSINHIILLDVNAEKPVVNVSWEPFETEQEESPDYRVEAAMAGSQFTDWVQIGSTNYRSIDFITQDFNRQIRQLFVTGLAEDVVLRVKYVRKSDVPLYSFGIPVQVTTYQPTINYENSQTIRIPGNFENWKIDSAPKIVSVNSDGEYEGFINFTNNNSQFLLLKNDLTWTALSTYYDIGNNKFGYNGNIFDLPGNKAGIYKFNASTNTNRWSCTKIVTIGISGSAVSTQESKDLEMIFDVINKIWQITGNFKKGSFLFRVNNTNAMFFGHNSTSDPGIANYNGSNIEIAKDGNFTIGLSLLTAGNYTYSVLRNN